MGFNWGSIGVQMGFKWGSNGRLGGATLDLSTIVVSSREPGNSVGVGVNSAITVPPSALHLHAQMRRCEAHV